MSSAVEWEAIADGLQGQYMVGCEQLWEVMVSQFSGKFSGEYPSSKEELASALEKVPTKHQIETKWAKENVPRLQEKLLKKLLAKLGAEQIIYLLPPILWGIVSEYTSVPT